MDDKLVEFEANFSVLDRYGVDVTADTFITNPAIGRDQQLKELMLILLTPEKSAILIGKPGIGKTAIVEGLAYRMQRGEVPEALKGYTIINIKTASLLGTMPSGESKVQKMIDELKLREKVILFVDEIHMLIGATDSSSLDFANIFKEGLGRGSIKVIGATTTEEYERYILRDKAFTRRFQKVEVPEPSHDETVQIMMGTYPKFEKQTGRKLKYTSFIQGRIMEFLVDITSEYKRVYALGSRYPDVCLTLLKQAFSYTVFDNREYVDIFDIRKAIENSKNIYPDVIKKELPRFDKEFNDIILEEKGEKPVEEWRKDSIGTTRYQQEANSIIVDTNANNQNSRAPVSIFKNLEKTPEMVDRQRLKEYKPVKTILSEKTLKKFAKIGPASISQGMKDKINRKGDSRSIDNLLLSSEIGVIKDDGQNSKFNYKVTDELKPGGINDLLLGMPISSTLDDFSSEPVSAVETYRSDNLSYKELDPNKNRLMIGDNSEKNFQGYRHSGSNNVKSYGLIDFDNVIEKKEPKKEFNSERRPPEIVERKERPIENGFGLTNLNKLIQGGNSLENSNLVERNSNVNNYVEQSKQSYPGLNNTVMEIPKSKADITQEGIPPLDEKNLDSSNNNDESLERILNFEKNSASVFNNRNSKDELLFGAPMYKNQKLDSPVSNEKNYGVDIFGQLITDNMHIKNGRILDGFDLENKSNNKQVIGDVVNAFSNNLRIEDSSEKKRIEVDNLIDRPKNNTVNNKKWSFLGDAFEEEKKPAPVPKFNELKIEKSYASNVERPSAMEFSKMQEKKSNNFVNFNDLNAGKIPEHEVNQYISFAKGNNSVEKNIGRSSVDLTLNDIVDEKNYFDDFYDN